MFRYRAKVVEIFEADIVKVAVDLGFGIWSKETFRLAGIDSSDVRDKKNPQKAQALRKYLEDNLLGKDVIVKSIKPKLDRFDKYLAFLYFEGQSKSFNDTLVEKGLIKPYSSEKKTEGTEQ